MAYLRKKDRRRGSELDIVESDTDKLQTNLMQIAFKGAVSHSLAKYNLQDQIVDEFVDATGIDTSASTEEILAAGAYSSSSGVAGSATGGVITTPTGYRVHTFLIGNTGESFTPDASFAVDYLVIGGGGGGGGVSTNGQGAGGGGAGAFRTASTFAVTAQAYTITVGASGTAGNAQPGGDGGNSIFSSITALGGGKGGSGDPSQAAGTGGSGGGGTNAGGGTSGTYGNAGGTGSNSQAGGGGGGATEAGAQTSGGYDAGFGGAGTANSYRTGSAVTYAGGGGGGGGGGTDNAGGRPGGAGGGGAGGTRGSDTTTWDGTVGTADTGSGGGGGGGGDGAGSPSAGGAGGSGIVVIRYGLATDLTLQSLDTTAETEPDFADMIMLMEDSIGTTTINTDVKGFISKDSGVTFTEGVLVDEGDWGTNKRILAFHDLDITAQSGTAMCYKITTHNQSSSNFTKIHAISVGWR